MSGARAISAFLTVLLVGMVLSGITPVTSGPLQDDDFGPSASSEIPIGGGTITLPDGFEGGERFLQVVEPPTFTRTEEALENPDLQPGDLGDQGGEEAVVLERRVTDYSYVEEESISNVVIDGVKGNSGSYLCVCDATFIFDVPNILTLDDSQYIWFDNITLYGGLIDVLFSQQIIVSNSKFIDAGGVRVSGSEDGFVHNITVIRQRGPLNIFHPSDVLEELVGEDPECWPHHERPCAGGGVVFWRAGSRNWTVEWSHFQSHSGVVFILTDIIDLNIRHNTFRDSHVSFNRGENQIAWNLFRGQDTASPIRSVSTDKSWIHNNSILFSFKFREPIPFIEASPAVSLMFCNYCNLKDNDFLGYGIPHPNNAKYPALGTQHDNFVFANDNFWGTLHDPRIPEGQWIYTSTTTDLILDRWETNPVHDVSALMLSLDQRDIPYWAEQITGLPVQDSWEELPLPDG